MVLSGRPDILTVRGGEHHVLGRQQKPLGLHLQLPLLLTRYSVVQEEEEAGGGVKGRRRKEEEWEPNLQCGRRDTKKGWAMEFSANDQELSTWGKTARPARTRKEDLAPEQQVSSAPRVMQRTVDPLSPQQLAGPYDGAKSGHDKPLGWTDSCQLRGSWLVRWLTDWLTGWAGKRLGQV